MRYCARQEPLLFNCYINGKQVVTKMIHRDLGMLMSVNIINNIHWTDHYDLMLKTAYKVLGLLQRSLCNVKCVHSKKVLYISPVRSQLQNSSPMWHPHYIKDIKAIKKGMVSSGKVSCIVFVMHVEYLLLRVMCVLMHVHVLVGVNVSVIMCILVWIHVHVCVAPPIVVGAWPMAGTLWWLFEYYIYQ